MPVSDAEKGAMLKPSFARILQTAQQLKLPFTFRRLKIAVSTRQHREISEIANPIHMIGQQMISSC